MALVRGYTIRHVALGLMLSALCAGMLYAESSDDAAREAEKMAQEGDYASAVKVLAEAVKSDPLDQRLADMLRESQRLLFEENSRIEKEKALREADALRTEASSFYDKGDLDDAIRAWSQVLVLDPQDDSSAWMIQKAQIRKQLGPAGTSGSSPRYYNKKIKAIADDITKLIVQAKDKLNQENQERKRQELAALEEDAVNEKRLRLEEEEQTQVREEEFITETFKQGQEFYADGKYGEALRAWEAILPLLAQDSELKEKISVLCDELKKEQAAVEPTLDNPSEAVSDPSKDSSSGTIPAEAAEKIAEETGSAPSAPAALPVSGGEPASAVVAAAEPVAAQPTEVGTVSQSPEPAATVPTPVSADQPTTTAEAIVEKAAEVPVAQTQDRSEEPVAPVAVSAPSQDAVSAPGSAQAPAVTPVNAQKPVIEKIPERPLEPDLTAGAPVISDMPVHAPRQHNYTRIVISAIAVLLISVIMWGSYVMIRRSAGPKRRAAVGKGFDPSKLAVFLKKAKEDEQHDKDIFKVR